MGDACGGIGAFGKMNRRSARNSAGLGRLGRDWLAIESLFSRFRSCQTVSSPITSARRGNKTRELRCTEVGVDAQVNDKNYHPSDREPFMNERQREYFRNKLLAWKEDILKEAPRSSPWARWKTDRRPVPAVGS